jgi:hypothetical protein
MATYQILYWHDIPSQVRAKEGKNRHSVQLSPRFQEAIDNAAMLAGLIGSDEYTEAFKWGESLEREGDAELVALKIAAEIESRYAEIDWRATVEKIRAE